MAKDRSRGSPSPSVPSSGGARTRRSWASTTGFLATSKFAVIHQEDFAQREPDTFASSVIPQPKSRKSTFSTSVTPPSASRSKPARSRPARTSSATPTRWRGRPTEIRISTPDTKSSTIRSDSPTRWAARSSSPIPQRHSSGTCREDSANIVSDGGVDSTMTITGWSLKESPQGNHWAVSSGLAYYLGKVVLAPNVLVQRPLEGPLPLSLTSSTPRRAPTTQAFKPGNQLEDPFWVRSNRETYGFELLLGWNPTPATPLYAWDNAQRDDSLVSIALDFVYKILPTSQDAAAAIGVPDSGTGPNFLFAFPSAAPARNLGTSARARS